MLIMIAGEYKGGKTVSACTFIEACKQGTESLLLLDLNDGFESVKNARDKSGNLIVPRWQEIVVETFYKTGIHDLHMKTAEKADFTKGVAPAYAAQSEAMISKMNNIMQALFNEQGTYRQMKIKVLVIDAASDLFRIWKEAILAVNRIPSLRIGDYVTLESMLFGQFIPTLKTLRQYIPWIIICNHITMDKDELLGSISEFSVGPSNAMGRVWGKEFDEVWKMSQEAGEYVWRTNTSGFFKAGSRLHLPDPVRPATYTALMSILDSRAKISK